jgi:hypothetical protein
MRERRWLTDSKGLCARIDWHCIPLALHHASLHQLSSLGSSFNFPSLLSVSESGGSMSFHEKNSWKDHI